MAHVLTDEAFALSSAHFLRIGRVDIGGYWIAAVVGDFIPGTSRRSRGSTWAARSPTRPPGLDVVFPAAMAGLAAGLVTGRRELVAAGAGAALGVALSLAIGPGSGSSPAG